MITNIINNMGHSSEADDVTFLEEFIGSDDIDSDVGKSDVESDIDSDVDEFDVESNLNPIDDDDLVVAGPSGQNGYENKKFRVFFLR